MPLLLAFLHVEEVELPRRLVPITISIVNKKARPLLIGLLGKQSRPIGQEEALASSGNQEEEVRLFKWRNRKGYGVERLSLTRVAD